jgi:hypothetical protein
MVDRSLTCGAAKSAAEFIADFAPDVGFDSVLLAGQPHVNSYMGNVIAAIPLGGDRYQPYVSGGFGSIGIRGDLFTLADINGNRTTESANTTRWGGDLAPESSATSADSACAGMCVGSGRRAATISRTAIRPLRTRGRSSFPISTSGVGHWVSRFAGNQGNFPRQEGPG